MSPLQCVLLAEVQNLLHECNTSIRATNLRFCRSFLSWSPELLILVAVSCSVRGEWISLRDTLNCPGAIPAMARTLPKVGVLSLKLSALGSGREKGTNVKTTLRSMEEDSWWPRQVD